MPGTLFLCGAGNSEGVRLALAVNQAAPQWERIVLLDDDPAKRGERKLGVEVVGLLSDLRHADRETDAAVNLVGRTTAGRRTVRERILASGVPIAPLVSADVDIGGVELARDVIIYRHATLGPESVIHEGCVVFMGAVVGHECVVGPGSVIAANAVLNARVLLDEGVYAGSCSTVIPEIRIGAWATIGAGSLVLQDVPAGASVLGVPAEIVHCRDDLPGTAIVSADARSAPPPDTLSVPALKVLISDAWSAVLGPSTNVDISFFDAGGTSLCALHVRERLMAAGITLAMTDLYRFPTVRALAEHLARGDSSVASVATDRAVARRLAGRRPLRPDAPALRDVAHDPRPERIGHRER